MDCFGVLLSGKMQDNTVEVGEPFGMHIFGVVEEKSALITETPCICALLHKEDFLRGKDSSAVAQRMLGEDSDLITALRSMDAAKHLSREFMQSLGRATDHMSIPAGTTLFEEGQAATSALILLKGQAEVVV